MISHTFYTVLLRLEPLEEVAVGVGVVVASGAPGAGPELSAQVGSSLVHRPEGGRLAVAAAERRGRRPASQQGTPRLLVGAGVLTLLLLHLGEGGGARLRGLTGRCLVVGSGGERRLGTGKNAFVFDNITSIWNSYTWKFPPKKFR